MLERVPLLKLQRWFGFVTAAAQLGRTRPESFLLEPRRAPCFVHKRPATIVRHADATWTIARHPNGLLRDARMLERRQDVAWNLAPLVPGSAVELAGTSWTFVTELSGR